MGSRKVDIVILLWGNDYTRFLERCLTSIAAQSESTNVIIMSDYETDIPNGNYKLYRENFETIGQLRNKTMEKLENDLVMFLDVDDYIFPNALSLLANRIDQDDDCVACVGRQIYQYNDKFYNETWPGPMMRRAIKIPFLYRKLLYFRCLFRPSSAALITRRACDNGARWGEGSIDDWPFIIDLSKQGKIVAIDDRVGVYTKRAGSGWHKPHSRKDLLSYARDTRNHCRIKNPLPQIYHNIDARWYARGGYYDPMSYHTKRLLPRNQLSEKDMKLLINPLDLDYFKNFS